MSTRAPAASSAGTEYLVSRGVSSALNNARGGFLASSTMASLLFSWLCQFERILYLKEENGKRSAYHRTDLTTPPKSNFTKVYSIHVLEECTTFETWIHFSSCSTTCMWGDWFEYRRGDINAQRRSKTRILQNWDMRDVDGGWTHVV